MHIVFEIGEMITLMNWSNVVVRNISTTQCDTGADAAASVNNDKSEVPDHVADHLVLELNLSS